jgi:hypothetical protein
VTSVIVWISFNFTLFYDVHFHCVLVTFCVQICPVSILGVIFLSPTQIVFFLRFLLRLVSAQISFLLAVLCAWSRSCCHSFLHSVSGRI